MIKMDLGFKVEVKITAPWTTFLASVRAGLAFSEKPIHLRKQEGGMVAAATPQRVAWPSAASRVDPSVQ